MASRTNLTAKINPTTAVILAGGLSSRMGTDKAFLRYEGRTLLDHAVHLARKSGFCTVLVSGKSVTHEPFILDIYPKKGPISGIHAAIRSTASNNKRQSWIFIPVDMPLLNPSGLRYLDLKAQDNNNGAAFEETSLPLVLHMSDDVLSDLDIVEMKLVAGEATSISSFARNLNILRVPFPENKRGLTNTNTPIEWKAIHENSN